MNESLPTGEKEPAKWELIRGTPEDRADLVYLAKAEVGEGAEEFSPVPDDAEFPEGCGMILRRSDKPIGHVFFELDEFEEGRRVFFISGLFILPAERSPGVAQKLIRSLREEGERRGATHVGWVAGSTVMSRITHKFSDAGAGVQIPIEQLDVSILTGRI
jgi:ribosomal protein S18 acetylase RimI-like enzyme